MRENMSFNCVPQFKFLTDEQIEELHLATLEVLERTGVKVLEEEALSLLKDAGAHIGEDSRVRIPNDLVKKALSTVPEKITLCKRNGERTVFLEDSKSFYGTGSDCPKILDSFTGERRLFTKADVGHTAKLVDSLPNMDFLMSLGLVSDAPTQTSDLHQFEAMLLNTEKPIVFTAHNRVCMENIIKMAEIAVGGEANLSQNPLICLYAEPISPLEHIGIAVKKLLLAAEKKIPVIYTPCPMAGGTSPATIAGTLVTSNAEVLSGLVIHQLKNPGAPFIGGGVISIMDMSSAILSYGAPELSLMMAAFTQLLHWYKIPVFGTAGCTDSKVLDEQAAIEATYSVMINALCGANLVHDVGFLEYALLGCLELVVMTDEVVGMVRRLQRGFEINNDTLALDIINTVGPGKQFLVEDHTLNYFKKEQWFPRFIDRNNYENWEAAGSKTMGQRLNDEVKRTIADYQPKQLSADQKEAISAVIAQAEEGNQ